MRMLAFIFRSSPRYFVLAALLGAASGALQTTIVGITNHLLARAESGGRIAPGDGAVLAFVLLVPAVLLTTLGSFRVIVRLGQTAVASLRADLARRIVRLPLCDMETLGAARLTASLSS